MRNKRTETKNNIAKKLIVTSTHDDFTIQEKWNCRKNDKKTYYTLHTYTTHTHTHATIIQIYTIVTVKI